MTRATISAGFPGGAQIARQDVVGAAAVPAQPFGFGQGPDRVVGGVDGGGDDDLVDQAAALQAPELLGQHRAPGEVQEHLPGKARRAHARLHDDGAPQGNLFSKR